MTPFESAVRGSLEESRGGRTHVHYRNDLGDRATPLSGTQLEKAKPQPKPATVKHGKTAPKPAHAKAAPKPHGKDANKALPKAKPVGKHHAKVAPKPLTKPANSLAPHGSHAPAKAAA